MARVKPPFAYFGSKGRFYKEIKEIFEKITDLILLIYLLELWRFH